MCVLATPPLPQDGDACSVPAEGYVFLQLGDMKG